MMLLQATPASAEVAFNAVRYMYGYNLKNKGELIMQKKSMRYFSLCMIVIAVVSSAACEKSIELNSTWLDREITIDGMGDEWGRATRYAEKAKVSLTLLNDAHNMYIRLNTRDRGVQAQVMRMGFTVWFDPGGGRHKTFGIRFPLGMQDIGMPMMAREGMQDPEAIERMIEESMDELEILDPLEKPIYRMFSLEAASQGIDAKVGFSKGNLVYEMKVPLSQDEEHLYAVGINKDNKDTSKVIGIGFETPKIDLDEMRKSMTRENMPETPPGGREMPPEGGEMAGGGRRMPGGRGMPERLNLWIKVKLASQSSMQE